MKKVFIFTGILFLFSSLSLKVTFPTGMWIQTTRLNEMSKRELSKDYLVEIEEEGKYLKVNMYKTDGWKYWTSFQAEKDKKYWRGQGTCDDGNEVVKNDFGIKLDKEILTIYWFPSNGGSHNQCEFKRACIKDILKL